MPLVHCPMASAEPIHIGAGGSANKGYRFDLLQDVADQVRYMLTSGPMSLEWPVAPPAGSDQSNLSSSHEDLHDKHSGDALPAPPHLRWMRDALQPHQLQQGCLERNTCVHIPDGGLRCVTWNSRGLNGSVSSSQISTELKLYYNLIISGDFLKTTMSSASKKCMEKMNFSGPFRCGPRDSSFTRRDSSIAHCQGLIELFFINMPMDEARGFHCCSHVFLGIWGSGPYRVTTLLYVWLFKDQLFGDIRANAFQVGCSNTRLLFCSEAALERLDDDHQYPVGPVCALADFKTILEMARRQTVRELSRKTPDSLGAKLLTASTALRAY